MKLIVGLGNLGEKYQNTRHNLGFMVLDSLLEKLEPHDKTFWEEKKDLKAQIKKINSNDHSILLVKPTTFMNDSGIAVSKVLNYYKIDPAELMVIHDDLDLPFGKIRVRFGGSGGGHHGVESIIEQLKTDKFLRIRLGIGQSRKNGDERRTMNHEHIERYVLGNISSSERGKARTMIKEAVRTIDLILRHGIDNYISRYNK